MMIWTFSPAVAILLCFVIWSVLPLWITFVVQRLPARYFDPHSRFFSPKAWERGGKLYQRVFRVRSWKAYLPDGAAVSKSGYRKKHLTDYSPQNLCCFLEQSCRAEMSHLLSILPFVLFLLFLPPRTLLFMLGYALFVNLPCVIVQRYNRPRILRYLALQTGR